MWGIIIACVVALIAVIFHVGKEGMREYRTNTAWTDEEIDKVKNTYVMGWWIFAVCFILAGIMALCYRYYLAMPEHVKTVQNVAWTRYIFLQVACGMITMGILAVILLLYAKKNPKAYRIICMSKTERGIKPTLAQKVAKEIDQILEENLVDDSTKVDAGYYGKFKMLGKKDNKEQK